MKIIKLFLLITFGLYAEFNLDTLKDVQANTTAMKEIVKNGWNDSNESLNTFIIKYGDKAMPEALQKIKKPLLKVEPCKNDRFPVPKILLGTDDYLLILSYVKYLEHKGETESALNIYVEIFKGLDNIEDKSMLSVMVQSAIQEVTVLGLNDALCKNVFSESMKNRVKSEITDLLTLDTKTFFTALDGEKDFILKAQKASIEKDENTTEEYTKLMLEVERHTKEYLELYFGKMYAAMKQKTPQALQEFEGYMDKEREEFSSMKNRALFFLYYEKAKFRNFIMLGNESYGFVSKYMAQTLVLVGIPRVKRTYLEYLDNIEKNKKCLNVLFSSNAIN